jgi:hypothetical protein
MPHGALDDDGLTLHDTSTHARTWPVFGLHVYRHRFAEHSRLPADRDELACTRGLNVYVLHDAEHAEWRLKYLITMVAATTRHADLNSSRAGRMLAKSAASSMPPPSSGGDVSFRTI